MGQIVILDPVGQPNLREIPLVERLKTLEGVRLGFLDNFKPNVDLLEAAIERELTGRFSFGSVVRRRKRLSGDAAGPDLLEELAASCDIVINGVGD